MDLVFFVLNLSNTFCINRNLNEYPTNNITPETKIINPTIGARNLKYCFKYFPKKIKITLRTIKKEIIPPLAKRPNTQGFPFLSSLDPIYSATYPGKRANEQGEKKDIAPAKKENPNNNGKEKLSIFAKAGTIMVFQPDNPTIPINIRIVIVKIINMIIFLFIKYYSFHPAQQLNLCRSLSNDKRPNFIPSIAVKYGKYVSINCFDVIFALIATVSI